VRSFGFSKEGPDADGEDVDAPCARLREIEERGAIDAQDRASRRGGVVDGQFEKLANKLPELHTPAPELN
jgi:hypothetical protein